MVIIVSGASSGIGYECAKLFASSGHKVYGLSRSGVSAQGVTGISVDVTDEAAVTAAVNRVFIAEERIDALVNAAGMGISGATECTSLKDAKYLFDVNFFGTFSLSKLVLPYMRAQTEGGRIINISSLAAVFSIPFQSFYSASKAAINSLSAAIAAEVEPFNVHLTSIMPGDIKTGFTKNRVKIEPLPEYAARVNRSVAVMEHDEQTGMPPRRIAEAALKVLNKKKPPLSVTVGAKYKLLRLLSKLLPESLAQIIIKGIYG
ncbi:MAG: SDR family oxidoreductase [Christensenellaceae bacterium]|jgi:short-subunit dehydrogenase|nr:SDR family oxidoreductase [Christensenellaceae bacterium]